MKLQQIALFLGLAVGLTLIDAKTLPVNANCIIGGLLPNTPCSAGLKCELYNEGNIPLDMPAEGTCKKSTRDTCFDQARGLYFAPNATLKSSDCGPCKCPATGGQFQCRSCILGGGKCLVGGRFVKPPLKCKPGLKCVLFDEGFLAVDRPARGTCKKPGRDTCFDKERVLWFAPRTRITNDCGPCKCAPKGGKFDCKKCVLEGGNCTVGGRFVERPPPCQTGLECVLYDEGKIEADVPARGNCYKPNGNTCLDAARQLYFAPKAKISNRCGTCNCPLRGGKITCPVREVQCLVDPCTYAKCPKHPTATCESNYCGGCNYAFYVDFKPVKC